MGVQSCGSTSVNRQAGRAGSETGANLLQLVLRLFETLAILRGGVISFDQQCTGCSHALLPRDLIMLVARRW